MNTGQGLLHRGCIEIFGRAINECFCAILLTVSGIIIPPAVLCSAGDGSTKTLSANGLMLTFAIFQKVLNVIGLKNDI